MFDTMKKGTACLTLVAVWVSVWGMVRIPKRWPPWRFCNSFDEQDVILLEDRGCSTKPEILYPHMGFCHCHVRRSCVSSHRLGTSPACSEDEGFATAGWPGPPG